MISNVKAANFLIFLLPVVFLILLPILTYNTQAGCPTCDKRDTGSYTDKPVSGENATIIFGNKTIVYFHMPGCVVCSAIENYLKNMQDEFPYIEIIRVNMAIREKQELREFYDSFYKIPSEDRGAVPAVFIDNSAFIGRSIIEKNLRDFLKEETNELVTNRNEIVLNSTVRDNIIKRFRSFSLVGVVSAGLIDGINPCAFVTLIFFISYLTISGQRGKKLLAIGMSFISAVFITYFLIGIGIFKFIYAINGYALVSKLIYLLTGLFTLGLVFFNINDSIKTKNRKYDKIRLQLPKGAKRLIHTTIRRQGKVHFVIVFAALTGILISLFEFSCTGQVYLPTIVYMTQIPSHRIPALMYLILYNITFILPLLAVFVLVSILGSNTQKISAFFTEKIYVVKIITAGFFLFLSGYMIFMSAKLFGFIL